jgi:DNA-binding MarR family transcriptional regulator
MTSAERDLEKAVDAVLETLPASWDRIRSNLRAAATSKFGISLEQFHILRHIRRGYGSISELAEKKQISRPAVSQAVDILVTRGLVTRKTDSEDRRCVRLELTSWASEVLDANFAENRAWMRAKMASLSASELEAVIKAMKVLGATFSPGDSLDQGK